MPRLPPVPISPHTRLRARFWPGVGISVVTFDQSHSSSSVTSCARPVSVPWPISERAMRITTVSSGRITTQALTSSGAPHHRLRGGRRDAERKVEAEGEAAAGDRGGADKEAAAAKLGRTARGAARACGQACSWRCPSGLGGGRRGRALRGVDGKVHGRADALVRAAAADVGHRLVDVLVARRRFFRSSAAAAMIWPDWQ